MGVHEIDDLIFRLNIDYVGFYTEEDTKGRHPMLSLRIYIWKEALGKILGTNIATDPANNLEFAIKELATRFNRWFFDKYKIEENIETLLLENKDLRRKFENWVSLTPESLMQAKTIDVDL